MAAAVAWTTILIGIAATAVVLRDRGGTDLFRIEQSRSLRSGTHATVLGAVEVQAVVRQAPEPVAAAKRTSPARVGCRPEGAGPLLDSWSCTIVYRSGTRAHYRVEVQPNGYYRGVGTGIIDGCCVKVPMLN